MNIFIYIDDQLLDLDESTSVAFTFQSAILGDIRSRQVSHTNNFTVPKTFNNQKIYDFAHVVKADSLTPYRRQDARVVMDGLTMITGVSFLKETSKGYNISIFENAIDFYDTIKDLTLSQLDFGDSPITWDGAYIDSVRAATSGLVAPAINYGQIDPSLVNAEIGDFYPPSIYYRDVLEEIFTDAGYTISFSSSITSKLDEMIIAYSRSDWQGDTFTMNEILPDMKQEDFVKHFLMHFGQILLINGTEITTLGFEDILTNLIEAEDWTDKRVKNEDEKNEDEKITYGSEYAQNNYFKFFDDDFDVFRGNIEVDNDNLEPESDIYESIFGVSDSMLGGSNVDSFDANDADDLVYGAVITLWDNVANADSYDFDTEPRPIVLLIRNKVAAEPAILYNGNSRTDYKVAYWASLSAESAGLPDKSMRWRNSGADASAFLDNYYPQFEESLNRAKTIERFYYLNLLDIAELDLTKLIFDDGVYYYINKIFNFVPGKVTKLELFKVK